MASRYHAPTQKRYRDKIRRDAIEHYGGKCACCGEDRIVFLCIDHIDGGGNTHRRAVGGYGSSFFAWLRRENYPSEFQVLCWNCNHARRMGMCPH